MPREIIATPRTERTTQRLTGQVVDHAGVAIPAASLATMTLRVYALDAALTDLVTTESMLNAGRGTVDASGNFVVTLRPADMAIVGTGELERHVALIAWTWLISAVTHGGYQEIEFPVQNLARVP